MVNQKEEVKKFSQYFNKNYGFFTYSGEMALEVALNNIDVENKKVVMPNNVCYRILLSVLRSKGIPILVQPSDGFVLSREDVTNVINKYEGIATIIVVHQYGIKSNVEAIKEITTGKNIKIIEDIAQGWKINDIGKYSDYIITSFGKSKQLSFGIGGAVFCNEKNLEQTLDMNCKTSRTNKKTALPYMLPENIEIKFKKIKKIGDKNVKKQYKNAIKIKNILSSKYKEFNYLETNKGVWNRYPIWTSNHSEYCKMIEILNHLKIDYELPYRIQLNELPMLQKYNYFYEEYMKYKKYMILIKTRSIRKRRMRKWKILKIK